MTIVAGKLDARQMAQANQQAQSIAEAADVGAVRENQFVFLASFDGTRNDRDDVPRSGNPLSTNVGQISRQADATVHRHQEGNFKAGYYAGHGTEGTLLASDWYPGQVTQETINTAKRAYNEFAEQASAWLKKHPNGDVTTAITAFSRGSAAAAVFTHLLYRDGLIDPADHSKVLIPPGEVGVSAGVIFDPVTTGVDANVAFAPNVKNVVVVQAQHEYRYLFKGVDHSGHPGIRVLEATGNHCNVGGGYDNGLGALYLEAATKYLQRSGVPVADVDPARRLDPSVPLNVYDESNQKADQGNFLTRDQNRGKWDVSGRFVEGAETQPVRLLDKVAKPASVDYQPDAEVMNFKLYDRKTHSKIKSYLDDTPEEALQKYPDLHGALSIRAVLHNEIADMPYRQKQVVMNRIDDHIVSTIENNQTLPVAMAERPSPDELQLSLS